MARVPQVILTLAPDGSLAAEFPTPNGLRRHVPIDGEPSEQIASIRRILSAQLGNQPTQIGTDAKPTTAQVNHWQKHLESVDKVSGLPTIGKPDPMCPWCIAAELGIDTTEAAYKRSQAILRAERKATSRRNFHYAGDGSVKVYHAAKAGSKRKAKQIHNLNLSSLLDAPIDLDDFGLSSLLDGDIKL